jgi:hypothetical protein
MSQAQRSGAPGIDDAGVRDYFLLCLGALAVLLLVLLRRDLGPWACLPVVVGLLGAWQRWRLAPILVLVCLAVLIIWREPLGDVRGPYRSARGFRLPDWLLSMAVLAYFIGHYRLQSLTLSILPADPRRREEGADREVYPGPRNRFREPQLMKSAELGWVILVLPVCALLAQVVWGRLPARRLLATSSEEWDLPTRAWQGIIAGWSLAILLFVAHGFLRYLGWQRQSPREARLTLQDTLWQETRREQRRVYQWLARARNRVQRGKEQL